MIPYNKSSFSSFWLGGEKKAESTLATCKKRAILHPQQQQQQQQQQQLG